MHLDLGILTSPSAPELGRLRQEDDKFEISLCFTDPLRRTRARDVLSGTSLANTQEALSLVSNMATKANKMHLSHFHVLANTLAWKGVREKQP